MHSKEDALKESHVEFLQTEEFRQTIFPLLSPLSPFSTHNNPTADLILVNLMPKWNGSWVKWSHGGKCGKRARDTVRGTNERAIMVRGTTTTTKRGLELSMRTLSLPYWCWQVDNFENEWNEAADEMKKDSVRDEIAVGVVELDKSQWKERSKQALCQKREWWNNQSELTNHHSFHSTVRVCFLPHWRMSFVWASAAIAKELLCFSQKERTVNSFVRLSGRKDLSNVTFCRKRSSFCLFSWRRQHFPSTEHNLFVSLPSFIWEFKQTWH